ncbi:MAG: flagellar basal body P-ring formation chaperone FlgA [Myxococcota bacterium]
MMSRRTPGLLLIGLLMTSPAWASPTYRPVAGDTPRAALSAFAKRLAGPELPLQVDARSFDGLPDPQPGLRFVVTEGSLDEVAFRITAVIEARAGLRTLARRRYVFPWRVEELVVVPSKIIRAGDTIRAEDLHTQRLMVDGAERYALSVDSLVGRVAQSTLLVDRPVPARLVEMPPLVRRGQPIRVQVRVGRMKVTMSGEALADGAAGDMVKVLNPSSKQILTGHVVEFGLVEVTK